MRADLLDLRHPLFWTVDEVLTSAECQQWIQRIEEEQFELATINRPGGPQINTRVRNNERVTFDDAGLADRLFARVADQVPGTMHSWQVVGANERLRGYRYQPGQRFGPHYDGSFRRSDNERSILSFIIYLNDGFEGGATTFLDLDKAVQPRAGLGLLFQHPILHEGSEVTSGVKYVVRSDIMYASMG